MKNQDLPLLRTHVANIALNKNIALLFLLSDAQETHGLTEYSNESYINDKLLVAVWMIENFTRFNEKSQKPWVELPEWEVPNSSADGVKNMTEFDGIIEKIKQEAQDLENIWDPKNVKAVTFLEKIVAQARECIWYTNQRLTAIQVLSKAGPMGEDDPEAIMSAGPKLAAKLLANPMMMLVGYLAVKNEFSGKRILASRLLGIILEFLVNKAVEEGYAKPIVELAK